MPKTNLFYFLIFTSFIFISCLDDKLNKEDKVLKPNEGKNISLNMKDTLLVGDYSIAEVYYDLKIDSLTVDKISSRLLLLRYTTHGKKILNSEGIKKTNYNMILDTVAKNGHYSLKFKFDSIGNRLFNIAIEDVVFIKDSIAYKDKLRKIIVETVLYQGVYIKDTINDNELD